MQNERGLGAINVKSRLNGPCLSPGKLVAYLSISNRLSEEDIPRASLEGRNPTTLKSEELSFWLKCHGDPAKGLKTKVQLPER